MLLTLDLVGIFVFGISGGLLAVRNRFDILGVVALAAATGVGGGLIRDVLIGAVPPPAVLDWRYLTAAVAAGLTTFWFHPAVGRVERVVNVFDAAGLGMFCVLGALKAHEYGLGPVPSAVLGMLTGVGGGVIRDLLAGRVPIVRRHGEMYAIPALGGAVVAAVGVECGLEAEVVAIPAVLVAFVWRLLALRFGWTAPLPR